MSNTTIKMPEFPSWEGLESIDSAGSFWDTQELSHLNNTLIRTVVNLKEVSRQLTKYEREKTEVELNRNRIYRTTVLSSTAKTESMKKQLAEIACEDYDIKLAFINEVIKELTRISAGLRIDLDILKTLSFNIRQEMKI
jgi:hypothetical protein